MDSCFPDVLTCQMIHLAVHAKTCGRLMKPSPAVVRLAAGTPCSPCHAVRTVRQSLDGLLNGCPQLLSSELDLQQQAELE